MEDFVSAILSQGPPWAGKRQGAGEGYANGNTAMLRLRVV
jgi:hypothetical protein